MSARPSGQACTTHPSMHPRPHGTACAAPDFVQPHRTEVFAAMKLSRRSLCMSPRHAVTAVNQEVTPNG